MSDTEPPELARGGDVYSKTLSLLRRILVGNGYRLEQVELKLLESADYRVQGRLLLELNIDQTTQRLAGPVRGGEARVFRTREEQESYLASVRSQIGETEWLDEVRTAVAGEPHNGWALEQGRWSLSKLDQRVALQMVCDLCLGVGTENCLTCHGRREMNCNTCGASGQTNCNSCHGNGTHPSDPSRACPACGGRRVISCHACQGRRQVMCATCRGMGATQCRECQGLKFKTEETVVKVTATGAFSMDGAGGAPLPVSNLVDNVGAQGLPEGHALIMPAGTHGNALLYQAVVPYAKMEMVLKGKSEYLHVVGMKPVLVDFPKLLDEIIEPVTNQINAVTLMSLSRKYRMVRELCEALARGVRPAHFFTRHYPYGISVSCAYALVDTLRHVFKNISLIPRLLTGGMGVLLITGFYSWWLLNPRPAFLPPMVPVYVWDGLLALGLLSLLWVAVGIAGKQALERLLPTQVSLRAASSQAGLLFTLAQIMLMVALLLWDKTRPEWVNQLLP